MKKEKYKNKLTRVQRLINIKMAKAYRTVSSEALCVVTGMTPIHINPYPTAFPYGNGMVLHFYQQQESSTTKTVHKVINKGIKTYV